MTCPSDLDYGAPAADEARALFERFYALLNEHDVTHVREIFTEDVVFRDDAWPKVMQGHAAVQEFLSALWRAMPDLTFELLEGPYLSDDGRRAAVRVQIAGTMTGPYPPGYAPTRRRLSTEFAGFCELEGGRICRERVIANVNDVAVQIGALPPPGSKTEGLAVRLQHLAAWRMRRSPS